jgi:hypothetical protein
MVFDRPLIPAQFQQTGGVGFLRGETGDPIDDLLGAFEGVLNASP